MSGAWAASVVSSGGSGSAPKNAPSARIASPVASVAQVAPVADVASDRKTPLEEDQLEPVDSKESAGEWTCTVSTIVAVGLSVARIVPSGSLCEAAYSASTTSNTVRGSGSGWAANGMFLRQPGQWLQEDGPLSWSSIRHPFCPKSQRKTQEHQKPVTTMPPRMCHEMVVQVQLQWMRKKASSSQQEQPGCGRSLSSS